MLEEQLAQLYTLEKNWDSYQADPLDKKHLDLAATYISLMQTRLTADAKKYGFAIPTVHRGVQLEWHMNGKDLEIIIDDAGLEIYSRTLATDSDSSKPITSDKEVLEAIDWLLS